MPTDTRPNILLITSEDNGPHVGCYGDHTVPTPAIDALAASGTRFANAFVTQAVCSPGRGSILTGLYPHQNGQIGLATHLYSTWGGLPNLPALLHDAGYRTGRIGKLHVLPESDFPFDFIWADSDYISFSHRDVQKTADVAGDFMGQDEQPFFLYLNYADAHLPWIPQDCGLPETPLTGDDFDAAPDWIGCDSPRLRQEAANYYNCLSRLDSGFGMLMAALEATGKAENTVVLYITDHGPQFSRGKVCIQELALRAPMLLRWPGVSVPGTVPTEMVSQIDVMPTLLDAAGIEPPADLPGASLRTLASTGADAAWRQYQAAEWNASHSCPAPGLAMPQRSIRDARYKLIHNLSDQERNPQEYYYTEARRIDSGCTQDEIDAAPDVVRQAYERWRRPPEWELHDLQADPNEWLNLADDPAHADTLARLQQAMVDWQDATNDPFRDPALVQRFIDDVHAAEAHGKSVRQVPDFRWDYLDYLNPANRT